MGFKASWILHQTSPWGLQTEGRHTFSVSLLQTQFQSTWGHLVSFQDTEVSSLIQLARCKRQLCSVEITHWPLCSVSHAWLFATTWTVACQAPLSKEFSRQGYWSGLLFPPPGDLPNPRIELESPASPAWQADSLPLRHLGSHTDPLSHWFLALRASCLCVMWGSET